MGVVVPLEEKPKEAELASLMALTAVDLDRVNQTILSRTGSDVTMIPEVANHLISSGGKRLRPLLTLATAGLCDYAGEGHIKLAASVEFMHTATLLHDDVVDQSDMRRGKAAARMLWGNEASVLVGDFLLGQAFKMMVEVGSLPCLEVLIDDALDYGGSSAKLGKNVGDDFREGKITLPVVLSFRRGSETERQFWRRALEKSDIRDGDLETALATMRRHRALEDTVERARHYGAMARDALELFPASRWKAALLDVVDFCISRAH